ncbi:hypothetical protein [Pseudomonas sp. 008]|uniref:hypothetical protein n=1 Tax=Pseudomonas sp. 008 TaxID=2803906 RepID=UPI0019523407|nr:hypothetical protein [Pseudomonas sp. 008]
MSITDKDVLTMPIISLNRVSLFPTTPEERIGHALFLQCLTHFTQVLGQSGLGLSYDSCNAAVAINHNAMYAPVNIGNLNFSVSFGSSRLYQGMDPDFNAFHGHLSSTRPFSNSLAEEHAEQSAILTAERIANANGPFFTYNNNNHIYIDLTPCNNCEPWLEARNENWYVHYFAELNNQAPLKKLKKDDRKKTFGRIQEPRKSYRYTPY